MPLAQVWRDETTGHGVREGDVLVSCEPMRIWTEDLESQRRDFVRSVSLRDGMPNFALETAIDASGLTRGRWSPNIPERPVQRAQLVSTPR
jgi:hypothetical protein